MAQASKKDCEAAQSNAKEKLAAAAESIMTTADFARFMTGVMGALIRGELTDRDASAICASANAMMKAAELQIKFAELSGEFSEPMLLAGPRSALPPGDRKPIKKGAWCVDCQAANRHSYVQATEDLDGVSLCGVCVNRRVRQEVEA